MKKIIAFFIAAVLGTGAGLLITAAFQVTGVTDNSMLPSYAEGEHVLVSNFVYQRSEPEKGDVVLFPNRIYTLSGESALMMKRVIAVSGDRVMITGGYVYVNNHRVTETYVFTEGVSGEMQEIVIPEGKVFVLGDNRAGSTDSRSETVGLVETEQIQGKVIYKW